jgi:hypothetical protein
LHAGLPHERSGINFAGFYQRLQLGFVYWTDLPVPIGIKYIHFDSIRFFDLEPIPNILIYVSISVGAAKNLSPNGLIELKRLTGYYFNPKLSDCRGCRSPDPVSAGRYKADVVPPCWVLAESEAQRVSNFNEMGALV